MFRYLYGYLIHGWRSVSAHVLCVPLFTHIHTEGAFKRGKGHTERKGEIGRKRESEVFLSKSNELILVNGNPDNANS
jgi:hypothetical protein